MSRQHRPTAARRAGAIRLQDVARRAGVSTASVSRVLNNPQTVSGELRSRIESAMAEMEYVPHWAARALASQRSRTVGAIVPTLGIAIFAAGVEALQERLHDHGHTLLISSSQYDPGREVELARSLIERGVDGLVLVGNEHDEAIYRFLENAEIPLVNTYSYSAQSPHPCVGFDNRSAAHRLVQHLLDLGHRRFGLITSPLRNNDRIRYRLEGMRACLQQADVPVADSAVVETPYSINDGRRALRELMSRHPGITAVACTTDAHAIGVVLEATVMGIKVPGRLSVTGFDDLNLSAQVSPSLTTVHAPADELGRRTADIILAAIDGQAYPYRTELPVDVILRQSTGPASS
jgi:LacI family transcriptional regulator